jgi:hypothetical protein
MDLPVNFKFDVRIRPRLLARGQINDADVAKHLDALPDLQPHSDSIDLAQPALTSPEERERAAAARPSTVVARPAPVGAPPAERSAPVSIAPAAEPVDEGWDEDDDEDDVDDDEDEDVKDAEAEDVKVAEAEDVKVAEAEDVKVAEAEDVKVAEAEVKAPELTPEEEPKAAASGEEE